MRLHALVVVLVVAAVMLGTTGCCTQTSAMRAKLLQIARNPHAEGEYLVAPPDELSVEVKGYPEYTRTVTVRPDGKITVPGMGDLAVQGMTIPAITSAITEGVSKELAQPIVTVTLVAARSKAIYVLGEVRRPGIFPYYGDMNLIDGIASASGPTLFANERKVRLTRASLDQPSLYKIDLVKLYKEGAAEQNMVLRDGDIIYVPPTVFAKIGYAVNQVLFPFTSVLSGFVVYGGVQSSFNNTGH
jgi:polysaccharide biosynthesis/export protein